MPFENMREKIIEMIRYEKIQELENTLKKTYKLEVYEDTWKKVEKLGKGQ